MVSQAILQRRCIYDVKFHSQISDSEVPVLNSQYLAKQLTIHTPYIIEPWFCHVYCFQNLAMPVIVAYRDSCCVDRECLGKLDSILGKKIDLGNYWVSKITIYILFSWDPFWIWNRMGKLAHMHLHTAIWSLLNQLQRWQLLVTNMRNSGEHNSPDVVKSAHVFDVYS